MADELLQDRDRGLLRANQARPADNEGLFQHVLSAQASMAGTVGEDDPGRAGGELPAVLAARFLEARVLLHGVVNPEHEPVVGRSVNDRQAQFGRGAHGQVLAGLQRTWLAMQADPVGELVGRTSK